MNTKSYRQIVTQMKNRMIAAMSGITDFNEGSNIMTIFESIARPLEQGYIDTRTGYSNNLRAIPYSIFGFEQKKGQKASVQVVFTRNEPSESASTIPVGTRISGNDLIFITSQEAIIEGGSKATVNVVFTRAEATSSVTYIPAGTRVSNGTLVFITTEIAVIGNGATQSGAVEAQAENMGEIYNVSAGTITTISDQSSVPEEITSVTNPDAAEGGVDGATQSNSVLAGAENIGAKYNLAENTITNIESSLSSEIVAVNNPGAATGGTDAETSSQMLRRFKYYINGLQGSNKYGIMAGVLGIEGVRSVSVEEHFTSLKDGIYNFTVYVDDGTGLLTSDLKNQVEDVINGTDTEDNPGLRAAGVNCDVSAAVIVNIDIVFTAKIYRVEQARVQNEIQTKLQEYINGLGINENVVLSSIIVLLKQISGITDVTGLTVNGSTDNKIIAVNQIARFRSVDATIIQQ